MARNNLYSIPSSSTVQEHADVLWDNCTQTEKQNFEKKIQLEAAR